LKAELRSSNAQFTGDVWVLSPKFEEYKGRNDPDAIKAVAREMEAFFVMSW
jgi:hypothetical protein